MDYVMGVLLVLGFIAKERYIRKHYRKPAVSRNGRPNQNFSQGIKQAV
jgi:hypothetical protein